jgi:hypothetical protein
MAKRLSDEQSPASSDRSVDNGELDQKRLKPQKSNWITIETKGLKAEIFGSLTIGICVVGALAGWISMLYFP